MARTAAPERTNPFLRRCNLEPSTALHEVVEPAVSRPELAFRIKLRIGARYSGTGSEQKAPDRRRTSGDAGRTQKVDRRGKAPCCVAASTRDERVSTWRKCGQVRKAKDPAPASRRPASRPETLGDHHPPSTETITQESGLRENRTSRLSERTEEGRKPDLLRLYSRPCSYGRCNRPTAARPAGSSRVRRRRKKGRFAMN